MLIRNYIKNEKKSGREVTLADFGVITPYAGQAKLINKLLCSAFSLEECTVCRTVDGFQGQERDFVFFSATRANKERKLGFLKDIRRLNVALTRARNLLVVVGSSVTLEHHETWKALIQDAKNRGCYVDALTISNLRNILQPYEIANLAMSSQGAGTISLDNLFSGTKFRVILNSRVLNLLKSAQKVQMVRFLDYIKRIASGKWRREDAEKLSLSGVDENQGVTCVARTGNWSILWNIGLDGSYNQVLFVYAIIPLNDEPHVRLRFEQFMACYTPEYLKSVRAVFERPDENLKGPTEPAYYQAIPKKGSPNVTFKWYRTRTSTDGRGGEMVTAEASDDIEAGTRTFALSDLVFKVLLSPNASSLELPFVLSSEQEKLVRFDDTLFLLSRSGTGKTTCLINRMFYLDRVCSGVTLQEDLNAADKEGWRPDSPNVTQILCTVSPRLASDLKQYYVGLRTSLHVAASSNDSDDQDLATIRDGQHRADIVPEAVNPAFGVIKNAELELIDWARVDDSPTIETFRKVLYSLDALFPPSFLRAKKDASTSGGLVNFAMDGEEDHGIIEEDDESESDDANPEPTRAFHPVNVSDTPAFGRRRYQYELSEEVTMEVFSAMYWHRLPAALKELVDANLVWTEIQSTLKGGISMIEESFLGGNAQVEKKSGALSREAYVRLANSRKSGHVGGVHLDEAKRELIYAGFQKYERLKAQNRHWDIADLTLKVLGDLVEHGFPMEKYEFGYLDEVSWS
jgi:hypothetical protein